MNSNSSSFLKNILYLDTLRRESFDIWRDTTSTAGSIEDSSSTTSYLNNVRKSSIPKVKLE